MAQWTVNFCNCDFGFVYCQDCELPCDHDELCPRCRGWEWYPVKIRDVIDLIVAKDAGWLYRTRRDAWATIEQ